MMEIEYITNKKYDRKKTRKIVLSNLTGIETTISKKSKTYFLKRIIKKCLNFFIHGNKKV